MCGIVAVLPRRPSRPPPAAGEVGRAFGEARSLLAAISPFDGAGRQLELVHGATQVLAALDARLRGAPGLSCLLRDPADARAINEGASEDEAFVSSLEASLDAGDARLATVELEELNAGLVALRDVIWSLRHDRLEAATSVSELSASLGLGESGGPLQAGALTALWAVNVALRSLDRLEVRGRDSAGLHLMLTGHDLDWGKPEVAALLRGREDDPFFASCSVRRAGACLSLVYKAAAEIGELGDNVVALRAALGSDPLLARALCSPGVEVTVVGHTRWASVGLVSEANAHPLNSEELGEAREGAYVVGVLNGDIDNYASLIASEEIGVPAGVTTDAKIIPALVSRQLASDTDVAAAFRQVVARFEGSVGIAANAAAAPGKLLLALRGSGQSLNVGLAEDAFVVASEPYGLVEETQLYVRMDGETGGQVVACRRERAGEMVGISRWGYCGNELPVSAQEVQRAEITTRDVDRRGFKHFFLKEISESPSSVKKTLRGKITVGRNGGVVASLGEDVVPSRLRERIASGQIHQVLVIGQGTAAVAGQAVAAAISRALPELATSAMPASELSGWGPAGLGLPDDMSSSLVVAVSQSGTTTDTNRTVDLVRARGAIVVSIVNRRNTDLVQKSDGVLYTSDGRDVEMSVASTKAFYSQVAAGQLLAAALADLAAPGEGRRSDELAALRDLPALMQRVLSLRPRIARVASSFAPARRSWAVVGSGPDRVAAAEVRIKLSELCYKAIALDGVEDKKHIDLSAEPMVFVCAASISGANAKDVAKEVQIFRAHRAAPVVVVAEDEAALFGNGPEVIGVPRSHPELGFVLAAMVGHLFGYEAALAIDAQAAPLREARALVQGALMAAGAGDLAPLTVQAAGPSLSALPSPGDQASSLQVAVARALSGLRSGAYDGCLNASTAARLTSLLRYVTGALPIEGYEAEMGKVGTPASVAEDLVAVLGIAINELTRPVDAIKHQAKTVTVGISRSEDELVRSKLVTEALAAGATLSSLGYRALRTLAALGPAVEEVLGYTRYSIDAPARPAGSLEGATITVVDQGGVARGIPSRTSTDPTLRGTKRRVSEKREVTVFRGQNDGRTGVMVPEAKGGQVTGLTTLHARFVPRLVPEDAKAVLQAYQDRYQELVDEVTEFRSDFDDSVLGEVPFVDLMTEPLAVLARHWVAR